MDTAAAFAKLAEAAEGWPTPNSYTHALQVLADEVDRLRAIEEAAKVVRITAAAPDYDEEAIRRGLWKVLDAVLSAPASRSVTPGGTPGKETAGSDA